MIKQIVLVCRKPGISREEFSKYWREKHAPLALKIDVGLKKYVQNHVIEVPGFQFKSEYDGFVETWYDDIETYRKYLAWRQTGADREMREDEEKFLDRSRVSRYIVEEHVIK